MYTQIKMIINDITSNKYNNILLSGPIGAGKTYIAKKIIAYLTGTPEKKIHSPTFNLVSIYNNQRNIYHYDLYRVKNAEEINRINIIENILNSEVINIIEWPEIIYEHIRHISHIFIKIDKNHKMEIIKY